MTAIYIIPSKRSYSLIKLEVFDENFDYGDRLYHNNELVILANNKIIIKSGY